MHKHALTYTQYTYTGMYGEFVLLYSALDAYLGNGTSHRTATMTAPLLLTSGPERYEAVLHSCWASPVGGTGIDL